MSLLKIGGWASQDTPYFLLNIGTSNNVASPLTIRGTSNIITLLANPTQDSILDSNGNGMIVTSSNISFNVATGTPLIIQSNSITTPELFVSSLGGDSLHFYPVTGGGNIAFNGTDYIQITSNVSILGTTFTPSNLTNGSITIGHNSTDQTIPSVDFPNFRINQSNNTMNFGTLASPTAISISATNDVTIPNLYCTTIKATNVGTLLNPISNAYITNINGFTFGGDSISLNPSNTSITLPNTTSAYALFTLTGAGGGGGGNWQNTTSGTWSGGGGAGGSGFILQGVMEVGSNAGFTYSIGAGGTAGGSSSGAGDGAGTPGNVGGSTTFTINGFTFTADGGGGGSPGLITGTTTTGGTGGSGLNSGGGGAGSVIGVSQTAVSANGFYLGQGLNGTGSGGGAGGNGSPGGTGPGGGGGGGGLGFGSGGNGASPGTVASAGTIGSITITLYYPQS